VSESYRVTVLISSRASFSRSMARSDPRYPKARLPRRWRKLQGWVGVVIADGYPIADVGRCPLPLADTSELA
jgi:hypothetical protein